MDSLLKSLKQQSSVRSMSVGDLFPDKKYTVMSFEQKTTQYGDAVLCRLMDLGEGSIDVFLPKSIKISELQISKYNSRKTKKYEIYI